MYKYTHTDTQQTMYQFGFYDQKLNSLTVAGHTLE